MADHAELPRAGRRTAPASRIEIAASRARAAAAGTRTARDHSASGQRRSARDGAAAHGMISEHFLSVVARQQAGLLLDANVLPLYLMDRVDPPAVFTWKKTKQFAPLHVELLH